MKILRSLKHAIKGIIYCIENERNMRIHTIAGIYVMILSTFFSLSYEKIMILILTISAVISAEMVNTAIERLTDMLEVRYNIIAKIAKDIAAGAVLVSSIFAIFVGVIVFSDLSGFMKLWEIISLYPVLFIALLLSLLLSYLYILWGPKGIKSRIEEVKFRMSNKEK